MSWSVILVSIGLLSLCSNAWVVSPTHAERCFSKSANAAVSHAKPIAEMWKATVHDCFNFCIYSASKNGDLCGSIVYHNRQMTCQAYGAPRERRDQADARSVVPADTHDYYERISFEGECAAPAPVVRARTRSSRTFPYANEKEQKAAIPLEALKEEVAEKQDNFMRAILGTESSEKEYVDDGEKSSSIAAETPAPQRMRLDQRGEEIAAAVASSDKDEMYARSFKNAYKDGVLFPNPNTENTCSSGSLGYFVLFGYSMLSQIAPADSIKNAVQSTCFMACSKNINRAGLPTPCVAANYDQTSGQCLLFSGAAKVERQMAIVTESEDTMFADKFCLQSKRRCSSDTPFIVYLFKQVHRKIIDWATEVFSPSACIALCVDSGDCRSVTYKENLCILHGDSPISDPSLLVVGSTETMVIENGCQLTADAVPTFFGETPGQDDGPQPSEWEQWSGCVFGGSKHSAGGRGGKVRVRHRECPTGIACEDLQVEKC